MPELKLDNSIIDDRYLAERCLGRGSFAEIFLAYDEHRQGQPVIIKALNTSLQGTADPDLEQTLVENFQNEAIALDKVRHPHIILRLGHGTAADLRNVPFHYLVLEYMPGGDLLSLCRKQRFTLDDSLFYFKQVAEALAHAHKHRVIHRDIKPNNLLLSADQEVVKIADFGVAKMTADDAGEITRVGTNVYAPPEHHPDSSTESLDYKLTPSADIYSLAKTIYTVMTGRAPRQFSRQPIMELPPELAVNAWADNFLAVLRKATATRVANRYQSIEEFWEDFARLGVRASADRASDPDSTIVRARLGGAGTVERVAPRPNFQAPPSVPADGVRAQKARIVVEFPQHLKDEGRKAMNEKEPLAVPSTTLNAAGELVAARRGVANKKIIGQKPAADFGTKKIAGGEAAERSIFDNLRAVIGSEWLRRVFIVFLIAALIGLVASTYYHFAERRQGLPPILKIFDNRDGTIANALNVNLRDDPGGSVKASLPAGTRVRVLEYRGAWTRVRILDWAGPAPDDAPEGGWVDGRFVRLD